MNLSIAFFQFTYDLSNNNKTWSCDPVESSDSCDSEFPNGLYANLLCAFCCSGNGCNNLTFTSSDCSDLQANSPATNVHFMTPVLPVFIVCFLTIVISNRVIAKP